MTNPISKLPTVTEQLAIAGQASRAREGRDQKVFVNSLFKELELIKQQNSNISAELAEIKCLLLEKKPKKAAILDKAE